MPKERKRSKEAYEKLKENEWRRYQKKVHHANMGSEALQYINAKMISKWSIEDGINLYKFPPWLLKKVYSAIEAIIYKKKPRKGRVIYYYIPEEWTIDGHPIIIDVDIEFNEPPDGATVLSFSALKDTFIHNKFHG